MPLYDYRCPKCQAVTEVRHGFNENHSAPCPKCGGELKRVFNPAPILFKGSGFYITDSRPSASGESKPAESKPTETKPAEAKPAEPKPSDSAA
ncbi:MAG: FmdB family zinc ribbon protein [Vulcanimicrobiaceae bacterium]